MVSLNQTGGQLLTARLEKKHCRIKTAIEEGASLEWESKTLEICALDLGCCGKDLGGFSNFRKKHGVFLRKLGCVLAGVPSALADIGGRVEANY